MRQLKPLTCAAALGALALPASAGASVAHTVGYGDTLWSIAARNNLTTRALAAANGLDPSAHVVLGTTVRVPTVSEAASAMAARGWTPRQSTSYGSTGTTGSTGTSATTVAATRTAAPVPLGGYVVRPGDTIWGIARRIGVQPGQVAWMNGLSLAGLLHVGTMLKLPSASTNTAQTISSAPAPASRYVVPAAPTATAGHVTASQVGSIAAAHGVPPSLAAAVAWQESGFNNAAVSSANARGVMQVLPGTWSWIESNLAGGRLNPASPQDNVRAGVLYLRQLMRDTGSPSLAAAAYYQGLGSVRRIGMLPETRRYVANVIALRSRFGG